MKSKKSSRLSKAVLISVLMIFIIFLIIFFRKKNEIAKNTLVAPTDLAAHPIYSNYKFDQSESIINIGIQPMYLPTGIIFEVIKRDKILQQVLAKSGKRVEYFSFLKGADVNFFLKKKMLDGGVGGDMPALTAAMNYDIAVPLIIQKGNTSIISRKHHLSNDLKGKRIAYPFGSISHYIILELLQSAGISENAVRLIPMDISEMPNALNNNEIDLFSVWEPNVTSALKQYPRLTITYQKITTGYLYFLSTFVQHNPDITKHLLAAVVRAFEWLRNNDKNLLRACEWNLMEIETLTGEKFILNAEEIAKLALNDILGYLSKFALVLDKENFRKNSTLHREYEFLMNLNQEKETKTWKEVKKSFENILIIEILNNPYEYQLDKFNYTFDISESEY